MAAVLSSPGVRWSAIFAPTPSSSLPSRPSDRKVPERRFWWERLRWANNGITIYILFRIGRFPTSRWARIWDAVLSCGQRLDRFLCLGLRLGRAADFGSVCTVSLKFRHHAGESQLCVKTLAGRRDPVVHAVFDDGVRGTMRR